MADNSAAPATGGHNLGLNMAVKASKWPVVAFLPFLAMTGEGSPEKRCNAPPEPSWPHAGSSTAANGSILPLVAFLGFGVVRVGVWAKNRS